MLSVLLLEQIVSTEPTKISNNCNTMLGFTSYLNIVCNSILDARKALPITY